MIAQLTGKLRQKETDRVLIDIGGVGYEVLIPLSTYYELGELEELISLKVYTHVREDTLALFGFLTEKEKTLFTRLIQISGIGPKLANTILSGLPVEELVQAVSASDIARISSVPGVGKKTAERIIIELRDKIHGLFPGQDSTKETMFPGAFGQDLVSALVNLGYPKNKSETIVSKVLKEGEGTFEEMLRKALRRFAG
jgi:Holliday junction DNA helicase RuvA